MRIYTSKNIYEAFVNAAPLCHAEEVCRLALQLRVMTTGMHGCLKALHHEEPYLYTAAFLPWVFGHMQ